MASTSYPQRVKRKIDTLERRLDYLEAKPDKNSWDKAEIAALDMALEVVDRHRDTAVEVLKGLG